MWGYVFSVYPLPLWWLREYIYFALLSSHKIGSMSYYPLFRVRPWNNGLRCMFFLYIYFLYIGDLTLHLNWPARNRIISWTRAELLTTVLLRNAGWSNNLLQQNLFYDMLCNYPNFCCLQKPMINSPWRVVTAYDETHLPTLTEHQTLTCANADSSWNMFYGIQLGAI